MLTSQPQTENRSEVRSAHLFMRLALLFRHPINTSLYAEDKYSNLLMVNAETLVSAADCYLRAVLKDSVMAKRGGPVCLVSLHIWIHPSKHTDLGWYNGGFIDHSSERMGEPLEGVRKVVRRSPKPQGFFFF